MGSSNHQKPVSRLDGAEILKGPAPKTDAPPPQRLGVIDGRNAIADKATALRVQSYEALARAKRLDTKPWLSLSALMAMMAAPDDSESAGADDALAPFGEWRDA